MAGPGMSKLVSDKLEKRHKICHGSNLSNDNWILLLMSSSELMGRWIQGRWIQQNILEC